MLEKIDVHVFETLGLSFGLHNQLLDARDFTLEAFVLCLSLREGIFETSNLVS